MASGISRIIGAGLLALCVAAPLCADTAAGVAAWEAGDYAQAVREWQAPAAAGDADAQFNLAQAYRMGRGVEADPGKAEQLYAAAAAQGNLQAADNYGILLYLRGEKKAAIPLLVGAATREDPRAQYLLGTAYFNGDGIARDWPRAYAYMSLASKAGLEQARGSLSNMETYLSADDRKKARELAARLGPPALATASVAPPAKAAPTKASPTQSRTTAATAARMSPWKVQLGAFAVDGNAGRMWRKVSGRPELAGKRRGDRRAGKLTVLYAEGFANQAEAQRACRGLKQANIECLVTR